MNVQEKSYKVYANFSLKKSAESHVSYFKLIFWEVLNIPIYTSLKLVSIVFQGESLKNQNFRDKKCILHHILLLLVPVGLHVCLYKW